MRRLQTGLPAPSRRLGWKHGSKSGDSTSRAGFVHLLRWCRKLLFTRCHDDMQFFMSCRRRFNVTIDSAELSLCPPSVGFSSRPLSWLAALKQSDRVSVLCAGDVIKSSAIWKQNPKTCVSPQTDVARLNKSHRQ